MVSRCLLALQGCMKVWDCCQMHSVPGLDQSGHLIELVHWQAHSLAITSIDYIAKYNFILTASTDARIKMWSFGTEGGGPSLPDSSAPHPPPCSVSACSSESILSLLATHAH